MFSTEWDYEFKLYSEHKKDTYWKYEEELKITVPLEFLNYTVFSRKPRKWPSLKLLVSCAFRDTPFMGSVKWNYTLIVQLGKLSHQLVVINFLD